MNDDVMRENYRAIGAQEKVLIEILKQRARELHDFIGSFGDTPATPYSFHPEARGSHMADARENENRRGRDVGR